MRGLKLHRPEAGRRKLQIKGKKKEEACSKLQLYTEKNHEQNKYCVRGRENKDYILINNTKNQHNTNSRNKIPVYVCVEQLELSNEEVIKKELLRLTQGYF